MRTLIYIKVAVFFISAFAMVGWTVSLAGGSISTPKRTVNIQGAERNWIIVKFFFLALANCGTFISNAADLQRYTRRPNEVFFGQIFSFPVSGLVIAVLGNIIACASQAMYGKVSTSALLRFALCEWFAANRNSVYPAYLESVDFSGYTYGRRASYVGKPRWMCLYCSWPRLCEHLLSHL